MLEMLEWYISVGCAINIVWLIRDHVIRKAHLGFHNVLWIGVAVIIWPYIIAGAKPDV